MDAATQNGAAAVRRRAPVAAGAALPEVQPDAADLEAREARARAERLERRLEPPPERAEDEADFALAAEVCGGCSASFLGSRLCCGLCHSAPCQAGCSWRALSHARAADYEWRLATRSGCAQAARCDARRAHR